MERSSSPVPEARDDVRAAFRVALQRDDPGFLGRLEQLRERAETVIALVERRVLSLHGLLDHRAPEDLLVLALQREDGVHEQREGLGRLFGQTLEGRRLRLLADEILVVEKL